MDKRTFFLAFFTIIVWSSSFAGIRASLLGGYSSGHLVLMRFLVASAVFILYALSPWAHFRLPRKKHVIQIIVLGLVGISLYHSGITFGQQTVSAGTTGMIIGSAPIFTALIAVVILKERLSYLAGLV